MVLICSLPIAPGAILALVTLASTMAAVSTAPSASSAAATALLPMSASPTLSSKMRALSIALVATMALFTPPVAIASVPLVVIVPPDRPAPPLMLVMPTLSTPSLNPVGTALSPVHGTVFARSASGVARSNWRGLKTVYVPLLAPGRARSSR